MVEAAKQSAKAAELMLNAERPYVFVENQKVGMYLRISFDSLASISEVKPTPDVSAEPLKYKGVDRANTADVRLDFNLRNRGKGVAVLRSVRIRMLIGRGLMTNEEASLRTIGRCDASIRKGISVIGNNESAECFAIGLSLPLDTLGAVTEWTSSLRFAMLVSYSDVYGRRFSAPFPFEYRGPVPNVIGSVSLPPMLVRAFNKRHRRYE
jgi:hypothetical protein